tara:strand:- start:6717 stop:7868 length:1152 start_codon:yes stop_codon:yes gene_type:complete
MGLFSGIKKAFKKVTGAVKKVVKGVAKGVKKAVKGVAKVVRKIGKGVKKLAKNKYVRMGLMIAAAVTLPMFVPAIAALPAVAAGAVTGAITGGAGALLSGGDLKDVLKGAAFGSATGAAFAKIGEAIKTAKAAKVGGESLDLTQGKLDAMGADVPDIAATATDAAPTIDISGDVVSRTIPKPDFQFDPTEVSKFSIDPNINPLDGLSPTGVTTTANVNIPSETLVYPNQIMKPGAPAQSVTITKPGIDTSVIAPAKSVKDSITMSQNFAKYGSTEATLGQKIASKFKEAFSPEKLTDTALGVAEDAVVGGLRNLAAGDQEEAYQQGGRQYQAGVVDPLLLQQVQYAHSQASVDFNTSHQNLLYGTADMSHYTPLQTQEILRIS